MGKVIFRGKTPQLGRDDGVLELDGRHVGRFFHNRRHVPGSVPASREKTLLNCSESSILPRFTPLSDSSFSLLHPNHYSSKKLSNTDLR